MEKYEKYLNEEVSFQNPDRKTMNLVREVAELIEFRGDLAAEFIALLMESINFHTEGKYIYNYLKSRK